MPVGESEQLASVQLSQALAFTFEVPRAFHVRHKQLVHGVIKHRTNRSNTDSTNSTSGSATRP